MPKQIADSQVYDAVIDTLVEKGYAGATTKVIAKSAEINEVTLFRKYGNKAQLVAAAMQHMLDQQHPETIRYTGDVVADMTHIAELYFHSSARHAQLFPIIMSEMSRFPELRPMLEIPMQSVIRFADIIKQYQDEGVLVNDEQPIQAVGSLIGPIVVMRMLLTANPDAPIPPPDLKTHVKRFLHGRSN